MKQKRAFKIIVVFLACVSWTNKSNIAGAQVKDRLPEEPDYALADSWYQTIYNGSKVDVFYIAPTCVWDWYDASGNIMHYADVHCEKQRNALLPSLKLAQDIFAKTNNFYAPYYRQITLESWMNGDSIIEHRFAYAMKDIKNAFYHYLTLMNYKRPFILAGFSQGAKAVVELIKTLPDSVCSQLVAAYVIGYKITPKELLQYPALKAARDSMDTGVIICYNSVSSVEALCTALSPNGICINPTNWRTDTISGQLNDSVSVKIDTLHHVLLVEGLDKQKYFLPSLSKLFKPGNFHLQELLFYQTQLEQNVSLRIKNYLQISNK